MNESGEPRQRAFAALYEADQRQGELPLGLTGRAHRLAQGTIDHLTEIDEAIDEAAERWTVDRMPAVDRALLRLATYELKEEHQTPTSVILSETVKMAKAYSTHNSGRFVNGVLSTLASRIREADPVV